jgi:hypothetical protein
MTVLLLVAYGSCGETSNVKITQSLISVRLSR